jgi:ABC-type lipoprotein release transport system permease subunit
VVGAAVGLTAAAAVATRYGSLLFHVTPRDPTVLAGSATLVLALAAAASWIPGRRAAAVNPAITLRAE